MTDLRIGGLARLSTCDWPGQLVATVFCQGCPWDCPYCHNADLIPFGGRTSLDWVEVLEFVGRRRGLLDGVVFSGGEPTAQPAIEEAIQTVRAMGFGVGLHTAGAYPDRLNRLLPWLDWVGFDIKAPFDDYDRITGRPGSGGKARNSLVRLLESGVACELRTTVHPGLLNENDMAHLRRDLLALGIHRHKIQPFRATGARKERLQGLTMHPDDPNLMEPTAMTGGPT